MLRSTFRILLGLSACLAMAGCAKMHTSGKLPLAPAQMSHGSIALEIIFVRFPFGDQEVNGPLWTEIDEQQLPHDVRKRLEDNGLRVGLVGSHLPATLERLLKQDQPPPSTEKADEVDLLGESTIHGNVLQMQAGRRATPGARIPTTGERERHPELTVLLRGDGEVFGRTFQDALGQFAAKAISQPDGRVRLELVPEIEHGEFRNRTVRDEGVLRFEYAPPREVFDDLRFEAVLGPGQVLVVGCIPELGGSLGHHYFTDNTNGTLEQKLLLIRLAQTRSEDMFADIETLPTTDSVDRAAK